jgi:hypothetical protein
MSMSFFFVHVLFDEKPTNYMVKRLGIIRGFNKGMNPKIIQKLAGHKKLSTTMKYSLPRKEDTQNDFDAVIKKNKDVITPYKYLL